MSKSSSEISNWFFIVEIDEYPSKLLDVAKPPPEKTPEKLEIPPPHTEIPEVPELKYFPLENV